QDQQRRHQRAAADACHADEQADTKARKDVKGIDQRHSAGLTVYARSRDQDVVGWQHRKASSTDGTVQRPRALALTTSQVGSYFPSRQYYGQKKNDSPVDGGLVGFSTFAPGYRETGAL